MAMIVVVILITATGISGCSQSKTTLESVTKINNSEFVGEKIITVNFGEEFSKNENKRKNTRTKNYK